MHRLFSFILVAGASLTAFAKDGVNVAVHEDQRRVDITMDGAAFTSYVWPTSLKKPVLYPLMTADGRELTRGFPLAPRPGERQDHPHHAGLWFNYGNVNGFDFWNNSSAIPAANAPKMGTVVFKKIISTHSGKTIGDLVVDSTWIAGDGKPLFDERTAFVFSKHDGIWFIDRVATLTALDKVVFHDDKEGVLGIRVARWLESPNEKGGVFLDANGRETKVEGSTGSGATGVYLTSEGKQGDAAWATRGRWCVLNGHDADGKPAALAIIDSPGNPGYPTYWHARGYGLFAANPLGAHIFDSKAPQMDFTVEKGSKAVFRYRILVSPKNLDAQQLNAEADRFAAEK